MLNTSLRKKLHGLTLRRIFTTLMLSLPAAVAVGGSIVSVPAPNGTDDTNNLQSALDNCMTNYPEGCTIQLAPGTYLSKQVIAENFRGTVRGMGIDVTTIEVLAPLEVTISDQNVQANPPSRTNKYPVLLTFLSGDIAVEDMTFKVSAYHPTTSWWYGGTGPGQTWLEAFVGVIGSSANLMVQRVSFEGALGPIDGVANFNNGPIFWGSTSGPLTGTFKLLSSRFRQCSLSWEAAEVLNAEIVIGGSPSDGNVVDGCEDGGGVLDADHSVLQYSYNSVTTASDFAGNAGLLMLQGVLSVPQQASQFIVEYNTFAATGGSQDGIFAFDLGPLLGLGSKGNFAIRDNTIEIKGSAAGPAYAGIESAYVTDAGISSNRVSGGNAFIGIAAEGDSQCVLQGNNLQQLQPLFVAVALLGLNSGFSLNTSNCTVVGGNNKVNVYDEGTNDILVGVDNMHGNPPGPAVARAMQLRRDLLKSLPRH